MPYIKKTETPANGRQIYINGVRYRSVFAASIDTDVSAVGLYNLLKKSGGAPTKRRNHDLVVTEEWILTHPDFLLGLIEGVEEYDGIRTD